MGIIPLRNTKAVQRLLVEFVWIPGESKHHHHFPVTGGLCGSHDPGPSYGEQVVTSKIFEYILVKNVLSLAEYSYWFLDL